MGDDDEVHVPNEGKMLKMHQEGADGKHVVHLSELLPLAVRLMDTPKKGEHGCNNVGTMVGLHVLGQIGVVASTGRASPAREIGRANV